MKNLELYIHIPFCVRKCAYCDFLSFESSEEEQKKYVQALLYEIKQYASLAKEYMVTTIFVGGGTPSILDTYYILEVFQLLRETFYIAEDAEITIEVNPGTITEEKVRVYRKVGINRVSIGLQATNNEELELLGRIHCYEDFLETYHLLLKYGISNINVDLISAIPKQTIESWGDTLDKVIALEPTHISAYSLIVEEETPFYENIESLESLLPNEDEEREIYHLTKIKLEEAGYYRYEISNYAKEGYECKHNMGYWSGVEYLGIGLGSASLIQNIRYSNERNLNTYIEKCGIYRESAMDQEHGNEESCEKRRIVNAGVRVEAEVLSRNARMEEFMFLGLRKVEGVSLLRFQDIFQESVDSVYGETIEELVRKKLVEIVDGKQCQMLRLTELGLDVSNYVMAEFLL